MKSRNTASVICAVLSAVLAFVLAIGFFGYRVMADRCYDALEQSGSLQVEIDRLNGENSELKQQLAEALAQPKAVPVIGFGGSEKTIATQGDILTVTVDPMELDGEPEISTDLGAPHFVKDKKGSWTALVSVGFAQTPGDYTVKVAFGGEEKELQVTVLEKEYGEQHMTMSSATAAATTGASGANEDYASKIKVLYDTYEPEILWDGSFIQPVEGRITTQFGLFRYTTYTDGGSRVTRHTGVDIACAAGTPVPAANRGRVVFAGDVIITGKTVVIEHGAGLKTYYFHMSEIDCKEGDLVEKGEVIGKVGSTGYSTGAHLHFEVKLGEYAENPWVLFDGSSRIYD